MAAAFRHMWWALGQVYYELVDLFIKANLLWFVAAALMFPAVGLPGGAALQQAIAGTPAAITGLQMGITIAGGTIVAAALAGPGTAALFVVAQRFIDGDDLSAAAFWSAFRQYFWRGWTLLVMDLFVLYALVVGFVFYTATGQVFLQAIGLVALVLMVYWLAAQAYVFALAVRMDMSPWHCIRNSAVIALGLPGPSFGFAVVALVSIVLSAVLIFPVLVFVPVTLALVGLRLTDEALRTYRVDSPDPGA